MNNSKIVLENSEEMDMDKVSFLQGQQGELTQIVEVINRIEATEDWKKLKSMLLDGMVKTLEKQLLSEVNKSEIAIPELYRLQGQLAWAKKYADLKKMSEYFKQQIDNIKNQLHEQKNLRDGAL
mgnify:CR=1 FL=1